MRRLVLVSMIACLMTPCLFAQDRAVSDSVRALYIKSYSDKFFLWPVIKQRSLSFQLEDPLHPGTTVNFKPNNAYGLGLGMYLFDLGVEVVFSMPMNDEKEAMYGNTKSFDLQLNMLSKRWGGDLYYQRYEGFYLSNPDGIIPPGASYPQRPDMTTENFGVAGIYIWRPEKFSLRSAFTFADRQLKSKGSFVIGGTYNTFRLSADSAFLTGSYATRIGLTAPLQGLKFQTIGIAPGYSYNLIIKKFFVNATVGIGPALQILEYRDIYDQKKNQTSVNSYADARLAIGYANDRFFAGVTFVTQGRTVEFEKIRFGNNSGTYRLLFGWRFNEVGFLKKSVWDLMPGGGR